MPGVLGHPGGYQRPQRFGHRVQRHRLGAMLADQVGGGLPVKGRTAGKALVKGGRDRIDIAGRAGQGAGHLLRCRVKQTARWNRAVTGARRDAEISQLADAFTVDEHVLWLVVPVHDTALVRCREAHQRAMQNYERSLRRGIALIGQDLAHRDAVDEFHDDGGTRRRFDVFVKPDDVQVVHGSQHRRLTAEHLGEFLVG